jgi:hypothetical protein
MSIAVTFLWFTAVPFMFLNVKFFVY